MWAPQEWPLALQVLPLQAAAQGSEVPAWVARVWAARVWPSEVLASAQVALVWQLEVPTWESVRESRLWTGIGPAQSLALPRPGAERSLTR